MTKNIENGWKTLAAAVIWQAGKDKQKSCACLASNPGRVESQRLHEDVDRFVASNWVETLCARSDSDCESLRRKFKEMK